MKKRRDFEQTVAKLRRADPGLGKGLTVPMIRAVGSRKHPFRRGRGEQSPSPPGAWHAAGVTETERWLVV